MDKKLQHTICQITGAEAIGRAEQIQPLWSNYGSLMRLRMTGGELPSVILKLIQLPDGDQHPRGWNTNLSHQRKLKSYQVEAHWYQRYAQQCDRHCPVPQCLSVHESDQETFLLLTDLHLSGFTQVKENASMADIQQCLSWLAWFHATFMATPPEGLWHCGSYWHLDTRPDELAALTDKELQQAASKIDQTLNQARFQTLIHGDAKLANFCFSATAVAAVDFQYVGGGCGIKDVAYFLGSCLHEEQCEQLEQPLLNYYFEQLHEALEVRQPKLDATAVEREWRSLFDVSWADFHRFLKGWSPGHWKLNSYSEKLTRRVIERLTSAP
ncbi:MAG: DUF1679 domain-containing protein [Candidatus Pelagadaptatus aseana]|uniref:phosphotransferase n=1 Tax=Candidatus Pelagadaptatus aseana TaxID=3120508 RepID=UPI0039B2F8E1